MASDQTQQSSGREVFLAGRSEPPRPPGTRGQHAWRLVQTSGYLVPAVFLGVGLFVVGFALGSVTLGLLALFVVLLVLAVRLFRESGREAEVDSLSAYAHAHGLTYKPSMMLIASTPLLAAGDSRRCDHYMHGELRGVDGFDVGIAHFVVETREHKHDRRKRPIAIVTPHNFTLAIVELPRPAGVFKGVYLARRPDARHRVDWLANIELVPATLEYAPLAANCDLLLRPGQDREAVRELLRPGLQQFVADTDLGAGFEFENGTLVVYSSRRLRAAADLDSLVSLAGHIARSLIAVGEPLSVPEVLGSKAPPTGVAAFQAPPPATHPKVEPLFGPVTEPDAAFPDAAAGGSVGSSQRDSMPPPAS